LPPGREFCGTNSITGEIALVHAREIGFDNLGETLAVVGRDLFR
jgi:hypothetical protein